jgi:PIN domain nuclease of toxin-antitoxin system
MNYLVDTHLVLWAAARFGDLPKSAAAIMADPRVSLWVSTVTLWEVAIKTSLRRPGFNIPVAPLRAGLLSNGYAELAVEGRHISALVPLPYHHADPFDRLLVAQAKSEGIPLLTSDHRLGEYGGFVELV